MVDRECESSTIMCVKKLFEACNGVNHFFLTNSKFFLLEHFQSVRRIRVRRGADSGQNGLCEVGYSRTTTRNQQKNSCLKDPFTCWAKYHEIRRRLTPPVSTVG